MTDLIKQCSHHLADGHDIPAAINSRPPGRDTICG
jgi:hypothetical protein